MSNDIRRAVIGVCGAVVIIWIAVQWISSQTATQSPQQVPVAVTVTQHTAVVNQAPDYTGVGILIFAVAVLLYVVIKYALPVLREWRGRDE